MIPNIKQVPYLDPGPWPNEIHMGFYTGVKRRNNTAFDVESPAPQKLQPYLTALHAAIDKQDADYMISRKAEQTELIAKADDERDALLNQLQNYVGQMAKMSAMPQKQAAAQTLKTGLDVYKPSTKSALRDESTQIQQWYQAYDADIQQKNAATELGITDLIASLVAKNNEVITLMDARADERAAKAEIQLKADREATDEAYHQYIQMLNALQCVDDDPDRFGWLISALTEDQEEWKQRYEENRRNNRRVSVKSEIVGNKRYAVSSGWTWLKLAQENSKALSPDPEPSAPGIEPIVVPVRIISLDTKAKKAGGLAVALNGVLVKPTDEINVLKDYELIPYSSDGEVTPVVPE